MALIPIGLKDLISLKERDEYSTEASLTHWLIAVEGVQLPQKRIYFHWKVTIYPTTSEGDFNWKKPFYNSANMESIDWAITLASSLVKACKNDQLSSSAMLEKIS